jgi:hypothetical protein
MESHRPDARRAVSAPSDRRRVCPLDTSRLATGSGDIRITCASGRPSARHGTAWPTSGDPPAYHETVGRQAAVALYVLTLVAVVVGVDVLFFGHHFWERLIVNVGIVLVFAAFGLRFRHAFGGK